MEYAVCSSTCTLGKPRQLERLQRLGQTLVTGGDGFEWQGTEFHSLRTALAGISGYGSLPSTLLSPASVWADGRTRGGVHMATWGWRLWNESLSCLCWIELHLLLSGRLCRLGIWNHLYVLIRLARENNSYDQQGFEHRNIKAWVCFFFPPYWKDVNLQNVKNYFTECL